MTRAARPSNPASPAWRVPAIIGGVLLLAVIAGLLLSLVLGRDPQLAGGDPSPTPSESPAPSAPVDPSEEPSQQPSDEPSPSEAPSQPAAPSDEPWQHYRDPVVENPDGVLPPGGVVRVIADALRLREQALIGSPEIVVLGRGDLLIIGPSSQYPAWGPIEADGYTWYPVAVLGGGDLPVPGRAPLETIERGWVAIGDGESAWVELLDARCTDDEPTLAHLETLTEWERLACYGDRQITVEGVLGCGGCGGFIAGEWTPEWLAWPMKYDFLSVEPQDRIGPFALTWSPGGPARPDEPGVAPIIRVTGHFDDAAAAECTHTWISNVDGEQIETTSPRAISQLYCREQFVVDSFEILGEDEDFPFG